MKYKTFDDIVNPDRLATVTVLLIGVSNLNPNVELPTTTEVIALSIVTGKH